MELRLHHRESTVTQYTKETPLDVPSCLQESASLTSAHSLAHQEVRSTETALQDQRQGGTPAANQRQTNSL
ncbi:Protein CBG04573 [Caenorhabditis briggsae]|uniref:Protein CBG04573 n=2 Tax=Caenorhabditis briggsae TaxID=6238 RepID=A8WXY7_CAEBR|nr:Protein CBG04573 [Caenorhabditis briggsae]UMM37013.1 hypothetical protein L5515_008922 [Caenorhabditis briggsae]CAP25247.1 Protein CBG04573 [Caenorhabditis briggsae]